MIWEYLKRNVLFPNDLNWVQRRVSRISLLSYQWANVFKFGRDILKNPQHFKMDTLLIPKS